MARKGYTLKLRPLELLAEGQIEAIDRATLAVLRQTGVRMESEWAVDTLARQGCRVDRDAMRVRFPAELVEECLRLAPHSFTVRAPDPANDLVMGGDRVYYSHSSGMQTIDLATFEPRDPSESEFADCVRVLDYLPTVDHLGCYPYFGYAGVCPMMAIPQGVAINMRNSAKHQAACCSNDCELFTIQMAQAAGQEITGTLTSSSPLTWGESALVAARRMAEAGYPITTVDGCALGGTGPATVAGSLAVSNAEHMAMLVLVQGLNPGHRMTIGHFALTVNMRTGAPTFGAITGSLSNVAFNQMWRHYGLPVGNGSPGYTSGKKMDYQAGYEKAIACLNSSLSGGNTILLHLGVSSEMTAHPAQAVLDHDIAGMIGRFIEGEEISEETIALGLIDQVWPIPGHYLAKPHTRRWWRREQYVPFAADQLTYTEWLEHGKKGALDYARERVGEILAQHHPKPLTDRQEADIERILDDANLYYARR